MPPLWKGYFLSRLAHDIGHSDTTHSSHEAASWALSLVSSLSFIENDSSLCRWLSMPVQTPLLKWIIQSSWIIFSCFVFLVSEGMRNREEMTAGFQKWEMLVLVSPFLWATLSAPEPVSSVCCCSLLEIKGPFSVLSPWVTGQHCAVQQINSFYKNNRTSSLTDWVKSKRWSWTT